MSVHNYDHDSSLIDSSSTNWLSILPSLQDKHILKFGTKRIENIKSLIYSDCQSLTCIGPQEFDFSAPSLTSTNTTERLEKGKFDLCLIDEADFFQDVHSVLKLNKILKTIFELLDESGLLLMGLPNGLRPLGAKLFVKKVLNYVGFRGLDSYFCLPSFYNPKIIFPYSNDRKYTTSEITKTYFKDMNVETIFSDTIKYLLMKTTAMFNPFVGILLVAWKSTQEVTKGTTGEYFLNYSFEKERFHNEYPYTIWLAKGPKQVGLMYSMDGDKKLLRAVCKKSNVKYHHSDVIKREYESLVLLSSYEKEFTDKNIAVPQPLCFGEKMGDVFLLESALPGDSLVNYRRYLNRSVFTSNHMSLLEEVVSIQIFLQSFLTRKIRDQIPEISKAYFENSLDAPCPEFSNIKRIEDYRSFAQHGDYTAENILFNKVDKKWSIIDWEWLASGYPHLFDLFYLFTSMEYRQNRIPKQRYLDHYFDSFKDTFFEKNQFSDYVKHVVKGYSEQFDLDYGKIFDYFLDFLLFHYNKYCLAYIAPAYAEVYKNMLLFALRNKKRFILY